jgi:hypothetical protein
MRWLGSVTAYDVAHAALFAAFMFVALNLLERVLPGLTSPLREALAAVPAVVLARATLRAIGMRGARRLQNPRQSLRD